MLNMISEMKRQYESIVSPLKLVKGLPIDCRFVISSLNNLNDDIPTAYRYIGLIFFNLEDSKFYFFKSNVNEPIPLDKEIKNSFNFVAETYGDAMENKNKNNLMLGQIVFVKNLNANFQVLENGLRYISGDVRVANLSDWKNIPSDAKFPGIEVTLVNSEDANQNVTYFQTHEGILQQIDEDLQLFPDKPVHGKVYKVNGKYYLVNKENYINIGNQKRTKQINIVKGKNTITNDFNSEKISITISKNGYKIEYDKYTITENQIVFNSKLQIDNAQIVIEKL